MSDNPSPSRPTVNELDLELKGLVRWQKFATHLPNIEQSDIEVIEQDKPGSTEKQKLAFFGTWLRRCVGASWLDVVIALQKIDANRLAADVKEKYNIVVPHYSTSPDDPSTSLASPLIPPSPDSFQDIPLPSEDEVVSKLEHLNKSFGNLITDLRMEIDKLVETDNSVLRRLAIRIEEEEYCNIKRLTDVKSPDEMFDVIRQHYNFLDIDLLETIADHVKCEDLCARIKEHNESVDEFKSSTPVESLRNSIIPYVSMPNSSKARSIVIIKLQKPWRRRSIKLVERLAESLFPDNRCAFEWFRVMIGSVYVMLLVTEEKTESLVATCRQKLQFMRLMGVVSLQIGSTHVLNEDENDNFSFDSALLEASQLGNNEAIQFLNHLVVGNNITCKAVVPQARHEEFVQEKLASIFMGAIKQNNLRVVTELMNKVSISDIQLGVTAACRLGYSTLISLLIKHLHLSPRVEDLYVACAENNASAFEQTLTQSGMNPNTTLISDITPLMIASSCGHIEVLECLLQAEAAVNCKDEDGYTPLAYAITGSKSLTVVQRLLESRANPNILLGGISIIEKAKEENGTEEIVNLLLKYSALQLHNDHEQLAEKVKKSINDQIEEKQQTLLQVAEKVEAHIQDTSLTKAQNIHELFNKLQPYYSFLCCDILVEIVREFIGGEIENELEGYLVMMRKFQKSAKIKQLKEVMSLVPKQDDTSDTCDVDIQLNGEWEEGTLENLQQLLKHAFRNKQYLLNHMTVDERDSLRITFTIPPSQSDSVVDAVKGIQKFSDLIGISRVSVGDVNVVSKLNIPQFSFSSGLFRAAQNGIDEAVWLLLEVGVNINDSTSEGKTALILASEAGHVKVVRTLLSAVANIDHLDSLGETPITMGRTATISSPLPTHTDISIKKRQVAGLKEALVVDYHINPDIQDNNGMTALMYAIENYHIEIVEALLNANADPNIQKEDGWTALMSACLNDNAEVVDVLLKGGADPNIQDKDGWTALMSACRNDHSKVVEVLLKGGANPNIQEKDGGTALMSSCRNGHFNVVEVLLKGDADPDIQEKDGWTALMAACQKGHLKVVEVLLKAGANPNIQDEDGFTALMSASRSGHLEVVKVLLKGNANPNIHGDGWTALMSASKSGHSQIVEILLKGGADPNIHNEEGWAALMSACLNGHSEVAEILLKGGADPNIGKDDGWTALMTASENGHSQVVEVLLEGGADPNIGDDEGFTALMSACRHGYLQVVDVLLKRNADPNIDGDGWTALMSACRKGHSKVVEMLLQRNADPNFQNEEGWTALMSASRIGHFEVVEKLLEGGADPNITTRHGNKALSLARECGHSKIVELLEKRTV